MSIVSGVRRRTVPLAAILVLTSILVPASSTTAQTAPPTFAKAFSPATIGPGSVSTLTFSITNNDVAPVIDLAFVDTLPAAITIADGANISSTCDGTVTAPNDGTAISFSGGSVGASQTCTISVDVTAAAPGTHTNTTGSLTSSFGTNGTATADLIVATDRPGFSKHFSPDAVDRGERSTLTFTIDNTANAANITNLDFVDVFPVGMVIADPAAASTDCGTTTLPATLTASPGSDTITLDSNGTFGFPAVAAGASCAVAVDVVAASGGELTNSSGELLAFGATSVSSGTANATLDVSVSALHITKEFTDDPIAPGGTGTLQFSITNFDRSAAASDVTFDDDLDAALTGLVAAAPLPTAPCGTGSTLTGTSLLSLTGGSIAAGETCTFDVTIQVPATAAGGIYANTTTAVSGSVDQATVTGNTASDDLFVQAAPILTKEFIDNPIVAGGSTTLRFTITDTSTASGSTDISFTDELTTILPFPITATLPTDGFCGTGSTMILTSAGTGAHALLMADGNLAAGASCTFDVIVQVPVGVSAGDYINTTSALTATVDGESVLGTPASDTLTIVTGPTLNKEFTDDPIAPGDDVTLRFTISNGLGFGGEGDADASVPADDIAFTDPLTFNGITGLGTSGLPLVDPCGSGSSLTDVGGVLTLTGGSLGAFDACSFDVTLTSSASTPQGIFTNTTSTITATVAGVSVTELAAQAELVVADVSVTKEFTDDPVLAGGQVTLEFTITNNSPTDDATTIRFSDDLDDALEDLAAAAGELPLADPCGTGSALTGFSGGQFLNFTGGNVLAGDSCTFSIVLDVPAAEAASYRNTTSAVSAEISGTPVVLPAATDILVVAAPPSLGMSKRFTNDPVLAGSTVNLRFSVSNPSAVSVGSITFTDDLATVLPGLVATGLPLSDPCGTGSNLSASVGNTLLTLSDGDLAAGATCTFDVTLAVPAGVAPGSYTNTTSTVTGDAGTAVTGAAATDVLAVSAPTQARADLSITKTDSADPVVVGGTLIYTITVANAGPDAATGVVVQDVLPHIFVGGDSVPVVTFQSTTGCAEDPNGAPGCGLGDIPVGTSKSYTMNVIVNSLAEGTITNVASVTSESGDPLPANNTTSEETTIATQADLSITKIDSSDPVIAGTSFSYTINVANAGPAPAVGVVVTDTLPAGVTLVSTSGCAEANGVPTCSLGDIAAGSNTQYIVTVDVDPSTLGTITNTASATSSTADSNPANNAVSEDTTVIASANLSVAKTDSADPSGLGADLTYTVTVSNAGPSNAVGVVATDTLPAGVTFVSTTGCSESPGGVPTCSLGDIAAGSSAQYTITVSTDPSGTPSTITNAASVSSQTPDPDAGNNSTTEDTELIIESDLTIEKVDDVDPVEAHSNERVVYTLTVTNLGPSDATGITVNDTLPAGVQFNETAGCVEHKKFGVPICTLGDLAAGGSVSYTVEVKMKNSTPLGPMTNTAVVSSTSNDPDLSNNTATEDTLVCERVPSGSCTVSNSSPFPAFGAPQNAVPAIVAQAAPPSATLPVTGSNGTNSTLAAALGALVLGLALTVLSRRKRRFSTI